MRAAPPAYPEQDASAINQQLKATGASPVEQRDDNGLTTDGLFDDVGVIDPTIDSEPLEFSLPIPLIVRLESDGHLIHPGETRQLTINAWRATEEPIEGMVLTLDLPEELRPVRGNLDTQWTLPELENSEIFSRTLDVHVIGGAFPFETAVVEVALRTDATETFDESRVDIKMGIDSQAEPPASPVAAARLRENGLVLRGRYGDVTLLVEAGSAELDTEFTYTDGYRWDEGDVPAPEPTAPASAMLTTTASITASDVISAIQSRLYLPSIRSDQPVSSAVVEELATLVEELAVDDNIPFH